MIDAQDQKFKTNTSRALPLQGWFGALLIFISWPLNWLLPGIRTIFLFFPLWLGYTFFIDSLVFVKKGTSLFTRSRIQFFGLFLISAPAWWLFEAINLRTGNWSYLGVEIFTPLEYFILASLNFSIVIPAVFGSAELFGSFSVIQRIQRWIVIRDDRRTTTIFFVTGWIMLALLILWPTLFFPFVWISVYFITEPMNIWLGHRHLAEGTRSGDWRSVVSLFCGVLLTGFFWEMWNFWSYPKWIYHVPGVDFLHIYEMPVLGYGGYLPFSLELFALYHLIVGIFGNNKSNYVQLSPDSPT